MAYQVLARKWRPASFDTLVGQEHVLQALRHALDTERLHHAYLFTGTRGVGKTSIARILARALNCEKGVSATPCGECGSCVEISEGRSVDLIEVDAASRTKVEDTRELLDNVQYAPTRSRFKIYLIDEVHMLSGHSFNALLKTLEEPPEHVKFLLATTDPQKLPATVLSRCLQFNLKNLSAERISGHLRHVLDAESIPCDDSALWLIGRAAAGSMRDALSLTDQAIAFGNGKLDEADVALMLGSVDRGQVFSLVDALLADDGSALLAACAAMAEQGVDFVDAAQELCSVLHRVAIAQAVPSAVSREFGDAERIIELAGRLTAEDVQLFYQLVVQGRGQIADAENPTAAFEMLALRLLAFRPVEVLDPTLTAGDVVPVLAAAEVGGEVKKPEPPTAANSTKIDDEDQGRDQSQDQHQDQGHGADAEHAADSVITGVEQPWFEVLDKLTLKGSAYNIASHCELRSCSARRWEFVLDEAHTNLFNERHQSLLEDALSQWAGDKQTVQIDVGAVTTETPAVRHTRLQAERLRAAEREIKDDPRVQRLLEDFEANVVEGSVRVLDGVADTR